jgi:hypothetical protein
MRAAHPSAVHDAAVHDHLRNQLVGWLPAAARITGAGWRPWASASFAGARHWFDLTPKGAEWAEFTALRLGERDWPLTGSFVADVHVTQGEPETESWRIELLTVDD